VYPPPPLEKRFLHGKEIKKIINLGKKLERISVTTSPLSLLLPLLP